MFNKIYKEILCDIFRLKYPFIYRKLQKINVVDNENTIKTLINSNKSISRFGDGEIKCILGYETGSFETNSNLLSRKLVDVLNSNNNNLEIGLPSKFNGLYPFRYKARRYWESTFSRYGLEFLKYLNNHKTYYDADITRPYMDYKRKYRKNAGNIFNLLKQIWNDKNVLIVEGQYTRLGVGNNLFSNTNTIKRIECPATNAFEHYNDILRLVVHFLKNNKNYLTLIALGPTATVLVYDLLKYNLRAIDVGHVDVEYEWYLMHSRKKVNIPTRYVNEAKNNKMVPVHNSKYSDQIIGNVK